MASRYPDSASAAARKVGYVVAIVVNVLMWYLVNVRPGWQALPFLTADFIEVRWLVNLSMLAGAAVNAVYLWFDPAWFKSLSQVGVSVIGMLTALRMWQAFPFDFSAYAFSWTVVARVVLVLAVVGSAVAIVVELARLAGRGIRNVAGGEHTGLPRGA